MPQMEIGKEVNETEGHEREAEDDTDQFLTSFAWKKWNRANTLVQR